ncbi:hypothetical protein B9Z55_023696 [Caenorhabditis nigoni]|uniref:Uncharacterized protein n=1 Tax=Caenorhabditis nigoni TaxID=1611254 RepID=A0A2G5SQT5_9PELO|nr:hypothetical protein B9Z55_023696 [Caenorhabditis nigoni]
MTSHIPFFMFEDMLKWMADNEVASIGHTPATCKFTRLLVKKILGKMETSSFGARWRSQVLEEARQSSGINSARPSEFRQSSHFFFFDFPGSDILCILITFQRSLRNGRKLKSYIIFLIITNSCQFYHNATMNIFAKMSPIAIMSSSKW